MSELGKAIVEVMATYANPCGATHKCAYQDGAVDSCIMGKDHLNTDGSGPYFVTKEGVKHHPCCFGCFFLDDGTVIEESQPFAPEGGAP